MSKTEDRRLELLLAGLLRWGTWLASAVTGTGLAISLTGVEGLIGLTGTRMVTAGIALFISLPVLRVLLMLAVSVRERDYRLVVVAAVVLLTILSGVAIGVCRSNPRALAH